MWPHRLMQMQNPCTTLQAVAYLGDRCSAVCTSTLLRTVRCDGSCDWESGLGRDKDCRIAMQHGGPMLWQRSLFDGVGHSAVHCSITILFDHGASDKQARRERQLHVQHAESQAFIRACALCEISFAKASTRVYSGRVRTSTDSADDRGDCEASASRAQSSGLTICLSYMCLSRSATKRLDGTSICLVTPHSSTRRGA
jgi:hypothetical protein